MAEEKSTRVKAVLGGSKKSHKGGKKSHKSGGRKPHSMHIRRSANGGYIAKHEYDEPTQPSDEHVLPDHDALMEHVQEHMAPQEEPAPMPQKPMGMM